MTKYSIILVDDHQLVRLGLSQIIAKNKNVKIIGEASNGKEALQLILTNKPDLVILDIEMPIMNGLEVLKKIKQEEVRIKTLIVTLFKERDLLKTAMDMNADGYIIKENAAEELNLAINSIINGEKYFNKELFENLTDTKSKISFANEISELINTLTKTEKQILKIISQNKNTKDICTQLFIAEKTVKTHRYNITKKLKLEFDQGSLLRFALTNKDYL
jgi:DNA-binding NarL/FixJ family response regulator